MADKQKDQEREEMANTADVLGDVAEVAGTVDTLTGMDDLAAAADLEEVSKAGLSRSGRFLERRCG
jgi:hypothetical protein